MLSHHISVMKVVVSGETVLCVITARFGVQCASRGYLMRWPENLTKENALSVRSRIPVSNDRLSREWCALSVVCWEALVLNRARVLLTFPRSRYDLHLRD